jgi:Phospholipase/Carboxylesterase
MATKKPISIAAVGPKHTATMIVAHGLGDSGVGWVFLAEEWIQSKKFDYVKFVFPNAPSIPITIVGRSYSTVAMDSSLFLAERWRVNARLV